MTHKLTRSERRYVREDMHHGAPLHNVRVDPDSGEVTACLPDYYQSGDGSWGGRIFVGWVNDVRAQTNMCAQARK